MIRRILRYLPWGLAVLFLGLAITFAVLWQQGVARENQRAEVEREGRAFVEALTNFSAETMVQDAEEIRSFAVGNFAEEVDVFFGARAIEAIQEAEATSEGEIESIYVQDVEDDSASVFAVVSETITNKISPDPTTDTIRMNVGMVLTDERWKVDSVEVLQSPGDDPLVPGT